MPVRSQLPPLRTSDLDVLELLRADRDGDAVGVPVADIASAAGTRWPDGVIHRLCRHRYVIGVIDGRYSLGHHEPTDVEGAPDAGRPSPPEGRTSGAPSTSVAPRLFEMSYRTEAA